MITTKSKIIDPGRAADRFETASGDCVCNEVKFGIPATVFMHCKRNRFKRFAQCFYPDRRLPHAIGSVRPLPWFTGGQNRPGSLPVRDVNGNLGSVCE